MCLSNLLLDELTMNMVNLCTFLLLLQMLIKLFPLSSLPYNSLHWTNFKQYTLYRAPELQLMRLPKL